MPELNLSQGIIYYEIHGKGEPLLCLHYGAGSTEAWKDQVPALAKHFTLIIYDRLGHGRSEHHLPYEKKYFENRARELEELLTNLGLDSIHLCGMCEGGAVALVFASLWPDKVKTLVLQGVGYYGTDQTIAQCEQYFRPWSELDKALQYRLINYHGEDYAMLKWEALREAKQYVWSRSYDLRPVFSSIETPTLIVGGDRDFFFGLEHPLTAYRGIKDSELCILPGAGHFPGEEAPSMFNEIVIGFLKRHTARSGQEGDRDEGTTLRPEGSI